MFFTGKTLELNKGGILTPIPNVDRHIYRLLPAFTSKTTTLTSCINGLKKQIISCHCERSEAIHYGILRDCHGYKCQAPSQRLQKQTIMVTNYKL